MGWECSAYGWGEGAYRVLMGKPERKRPLGRPRRRWVDNIKIDLQEVGCGYMDWIGLPQDRDRWRTLVSAVRTFGFREIRGISWLAANQLASQERLHHGVSNMVDHKCVEICTDHWPKRDSYRERNWACLERCGTLLDTSVGGTTEPLLVWVTDCSVTAYRLIAPRISSSF